MKATCVRLGALCARLCCVIVFTCQQLDAKSYSFILVCPPNVTVNCYDDLTDLDKYGKAYIWKNNVKSPAPPPVQIIYNTNACAIGTITRYWEVMDSYGVLQKCSQVITIVGGILFNSSDISWPPAYTLEGCNPSTDPKNLPAPYDFPKFSKLKCSQPMYSYKDMKFTVSDGCMKILRDWKVIDWCQYNPKAYPPVGLWTYTQVIKLIVTDSSAQLNCPKDTVVESRLDCKGVYVKLDSAKAISKCGFALKIRNTSPFAKDPGPDASGDYPLGTTEFYFIAEYGCGKEIKCKVQVTVKNKIGPVPYCLNGLIIALMPVDTNVDGTPDDGMIEVWAKDFNHGSYHPCKYKQLKFSFSSDTNYKSRIFTCAELGKNDIEMWVTDSLGNQSYCKTHVEIQNNNANIPDCKRKDSIKTNIVISGLVRDENQQWIDNVQLSLSMNPVQTIISKTVMNITTRYDTIVTKSGLTFYIQKKDTSYTTVNDTVQNQWRSDVMTGVDGKYNFRDLLKKQSYHLDVTKREGALNGININDVIVLLRHISGAQFLKDPYKIIAADINSDAKVDRQDFELLYALVQGTAAYKDLPKHWRFIPDGFVFLNPLNPLNEKFEYTLDFNNITASQLAVNYQAVRIGELDGIRNATDPPALEDRNSNTDFTEGTDFDILNVFPNPAISDEVYFEIQNAKTNNLIINWYDVHGNLLQRDSRSFDKGVQSWRQPVSHFPQQAMVFYRMTNGTHQCAGKLTRSK